MMRGSRSRDARRVTCRRRTWQLAVLTALLATACAVPGCSLGVMAGKMLFGNPQVPAAFTMATGVNLVDGEATVVVIARVPSYLSGDLATLESDLITGVTDHLVRESIEAQSADEVVDWIDERGSSDDIEAAAARFETDYVIHIDLATFENHEDKTPWLHRGRSAGTVTAYHVESVDGKRVPRLVFERGFDERHPRRQPVPVGEVSRSVFVRRHLEQLTADIARKFHSHLPGAGI